MAVIGVVGAETVLAGAGGAGVACGSGRFPRTCGREAREAPNPSWTPCDGNDERERKVVEKEGGKRTSRPLPPVVKR